MSNTGEEFNLFLKKQKFICQAKTCEILRHYIWASIMWRRAGKLDEADKCERIAQAMAENDKIKFVAEKPVILR